MVWQHRTTLASFFLVLLFFSAPAAADHLLALDDATGRAQLDPYLEVLRDETDSLGLDEVRALHKQGKFQHMRRSAMGFRSGSYWFHLHLVNNDRRQQQWLLMQRFALTDRIDVHVIPPVGPARHFYSGNALPFSQRAVAYRYPNFWLELPTGEITDIYIRLRSRNSMQVELALYRPQSFAESVRDGQLGIGLYYGILLALLVYNLVLWFSLREADYFWYVFHIVAFGLVLLVYNGLAFQYLWPSVPRAAQVAMPICLSIALVGMVQFARKFLELRTRWLPGDRASRVIMVFCAVLAVLALIAPAAAMPLPSAAVLLCVAWLAVAGIHALRTGYRPARLFLLAWTLLLVGIAMFSAVGFGLLQRNFLTEYGLQIGSATEMLLLSLALGSRYATLRSENERIVRDAKAQLEGEVEQRTAELRHALAQLGDAHARLRESSRRDGLTGLLTRSHFREAFAAQVMRAREHAEPLSLLMIDIDHFKRINDNFGHLVGDECLRWAAHAIGQSLRRYDALLARFGGEEFVVALPGRDLEGALEVAEEVRDRLSLEPCRGSDYIVEMTASIGVHQVDLVRERGMDAALQLADEALYRAKHDGRNCVRHA